MSLIYPKHKRLMKYPSRILRPHHRVKPAEDKDPTWYQYFLGLLVGAYRAKAKRKDYKNVYCIKDSSLTTDELIHSHLRGDE